VALAVDLLVKFLEELLALMLFFFDGSIGEPDDHLFVLVVFVGLRGGHSALPRRHRIRVKATEATTCLSSALIAHSVELAYFLVDLLDPRRLILHLALNSHCLLASDCLGKQVHGKCDADH